MKTLCITKFVSVGVIQFDISDHYPAIIKLKSKTQRKDIARSMVRKILTNTIENFVEDLDKNLQKHFRDDLTLKNINELINCVKLLQIISFPKLECQESNSKLQKSHGLAY